jgi:cytochrome c oxidase cbb3-type subunit 3
MRLKQSLVAATVLGALLSSVYWSLAQQAPASPPAARPTGGFVPGQARPPIDPAIVARGKTLYGINCQGCHGPDLRGGDLGGPNLLRSQVALSDQNGELIVPIIQGGRRAQGMPAIGISIEDSNTVAAYVRSVIGQIGRQGTPPGEQKALNIVTGNAADGKAFFALKCQSCHSPEGDLRGLSKKVPNPKTLQNLWLAGGVHNGISDGPPTTVSVSVPGGETAEGQLVQLDDFLVTLKRTDGTTRTFRRSGAVPKVTVNDPLKAHKDLLPTYTDKEIHDVTAYLVTIQ